MKTCRFLGLKKRKLLMKHKISLGKVQETLLIPLWSRAMEAKKPSPIIKDLKALEILEKIDYDFSKFKRAKGTQVGACLRGLLIDKWVKDFIKEHPKGTIVEIGAGLDTRFERIDNGQIKWFDLDLPDSMEVRKKFFQETDRRKFISGSVLEPAWIDIVKAAGSEPVFFITEGVLIYLKEEEIKKFLHMIADNFPGSSLAFDAIAPFMVMLQCFHDSVRHMAARFTWGISNVRNIEKWDSRFKINEALTLRNAPPEHYRHMPAILRFGFLVIPLLRHVCNVNLATIG